MIATFKQSFAGSLSTENSLKVLIKEFKNLTSFPILVNTSFNIRGEPIVNTVEDAFRCFMGTGIDILVCEDFILYKNQQNQKLLKDYKNTFELD